MAMNNSTNVRKALDRARPSAPAPESALRLSGTQARTDQQAPSETWDGIDEASWESFPASDPPAHWAGKDLQPAPEPEEQEEEQRAETD